MISRMGSWLYAVLVAARLLISAFASAPDPAVLSAAAVALELGDPVGAFTLLTDSADKSDGSDDLSYLYNADGDTLCRADRVDGEALPPDAGASGDFPDARSELPDADVFGGLPDATVLSPDGPRPGQPDAGASPVGTAPASDASRSDSADGSDAAPHYSDASGASVPAATGRSSAVPGLPPDETAAVAASPDGLRSDPEDAAVPASSAPLAWPEIRSFTDCAGVRLRNTTGFSVDLPALLAEPLPQTLSSDGAQILIIHTHGTEAYTPTEDAPYVESDPYRTTDADNSVVHIGDVLAAELEEAGLRVVHDRAFYDYPSYTSSYTLCGEAIARNLTENPTISVVIDLHRDALGDDSVIYRTCTADAAAAQLMLVVGTGENGLSHPRWRDNLKLALALQSAAERDTPTLMRTLQLVPERYNQQLTTGSFILEVGTTGNTLSEAEEAVRRFAASAAPLFLSLVV